MIAYIVNMTLCAALLYVIYFLVLEKENMHRFKRVYLLCSLVFSITVPLLKIDIFVPQISENLQFFYASFVESENIEIQPTASEVITHPNVNYYLIIFLAYITVTAFFVLRFLKNILKIFLCGKNNFSIKYKGAKIVLISQKLVPHSFWKYIFVNKDDYENDRIAEEIIIHEFAHIKQKHSLDNIFAEMLIIIFWFNPVFYLFRNKIKQNHEFLADLSVIKSNKNISRYQAILLSAITQKANVLLTSNFNYLITKKRLIMMTKTTSKTRALCKQFAIIPVLIAAICIFSSKTIAQSVTGILPQQTSGNVDEIINVGQGVSQELLDEFLVIENKHLDKITEDGKPYKYKFHWKNRSLSTEDNDRLYSIYIQMNEVQRNKQYIHFYCVLNPYKLRYPNKDEWNAYKKAPVVYLDGEKVDNSVLDSYVRTNFVYFTCGSYQNERHTTFWTKSGYDKYIQKYGEKISLPELLKMSPLIIFVDTKKEL